MSHCQDTEESWPWKRVIFFQCFQRKSATPISSNNHSYFKKIYSRTLSLGTGDKLMNKAHYLCLRLVQQMCTYSLRFISSRHWKHAGINSWWVSGNLTSQGLVISHMDRRVKSEGPSSVRGPFVSDSYWTIELWMRDLLL